MPLSALENSFLRQSADLKRESASLNSEIIGKLLAVVRNFKASASRSLRFKVKEGEKLLSGRAS